MKRQLVVMLGISSLISILGITLSLYIMQVFDRVLSSRSEDTLLFLSLAAILALSTASALDGVRSVALGRIAEWVVRRLAPNILARAIERRLSDPHLRVEMLRDLSQLRGFISGPGLPALLDLPWTPIYLLVAFLIHPMIGLVGVCGAVALFGIALLNERLNSSQMREAAQISSTALRDSDAMLRNAEVVDSLGMAPQLIHRWSGQLVRELSLQDQIQTRSAFIVSGTRFTRSIIQVILYSVAALLVLEQEMTGGAMMAGSIIVSRLLAPVEAILVHWRSLLMAREVHRRLGEFFAAPSLRSTETELPAPRGRLDVQQISVVTAAHPMPILRNVSFTLAAGEQLAIIGPAASGKTTLSRVILGIMRAQTGVVRLDGVDVSKWRREEFGRYIGYLPQDVELFSGTIAENICRFTSCDDAEIIRAARIAGCHNMILALPNAYDTEIGEGGTLLSGGQRQQIGLARALFGQPRFVVLDEPNSNLDMRGDQALRFALARLKAAGVTTIIVTHRQSVIAQVDKLLVMNSGAVRAFGEKRRVLAEMREPAEPPPPETAPLVAGRSDDTDMEAANPLDRALA